jgi:methyl-accepting chemotaxis protein
MTLQEGSAEIMNSMLFRFWGGAMLRLHNKTASGVDASPAGKVARSIRFGVRGKLQTAFGVAALMTIVAAGIGIISFSATEREFQRVASHDVPMMTDALRLSAMSGEISAAAARFVSARTADEQRAIVDMIATNSRDLSAMMSRLRASQKDIPSFAAVESASQRLEQNLKTLEKAILERTELRAKLEARQGALHQVHSKIAEKLGPIVDDSYFEVVGVAEDLGKAGAGTITSITNGGLQRLQTIVDIGAEINLATGVLVAGSVAPSPQMLVLLEDRSAVSALRAQKLLAKLPTDGEFAPLRAQITTLLQLAQFKATDRGDDTERLKNIFRAHESLAGLLIKLVDDLNFSLVMSGEDAVKKSTGLLKTLTSTHISGLRNALEAAAQTHLLASLVSEGATVKDPARLVPIQDRFRAAAELVNKSSKSISEDVSKNIGDLITFGSGSDGVFALRARELQADQVASQAVVDNVAIQLELDTAVGGLVAAAERNMKQSQSKMFESLTRDRTTLLIVSIGAILVAAGIGVFYVQRKLVKPLTAINDSMRRLSAGETDLALPKVRANDEIAAMARAVIVFRDAALERERLERQTAEQYALAEEQRSKINEERLKSEQERRKNAEAQESVAQEQARVVASLAEGMHKLSEGDLAFQLNEDGFGSNRKIFEDFNHMVARVAAIMSTIATSAQEVNSSAAEISAATTDLSQRIEEQATSLEETTASMEEISKNVKMNSDHSQHANSLVGSTCERALRSGEVVTRAVKAMSRIEDSSKNIADIIGVIDEIARQTNLLALNAAVEAARAGEAGRGFAVVASEVRSLAERSSQAAKGIKDLINNSKNQVKEGVELVNSAGQSLAEIGTSIKCVADIVSEIARNSAEQARGIDHVNKALAQMDAVTQQNSSLVEENAATAKALDQRATAMSEQVGVFKLDMPERYSNEERAA